MIMLCSRSNSSVNKRVGAYLLLELFPCLTTLEHAQQVFTILCYLIVILLQYVQTFYIGQLDNNICIQRHGGSTLSITKKRERHNPKSKFN
jgi:hypothetical protein